jgi:hypothetical protein
VIYFQINDRNAKNIVLHLSKHRDRELTRTDLLEELKLKMSDGDLEKKLKALVKADIINQGASNFAEYLLLDQLRIHARKSNELLKSITRYLPDDFDFCEYSRVWKYDSSPAYAKSFNVDIFARPANAGDYAIIGEVKSRDTRKFSREEAVAFETKFFEVKKLENIDAAVGFIFSRSGFSKEAEDYCREKGIACSEGL